MLTTTMASSGTAMACGKPIFEGIGRFFQDATFSDFTIQCGSVSWPVHKIVIAAHSDVFQVACGGNFKEGLEGSLVLHDDHSFVVHQMLRFMYTGQYQDDGSDLHDNAVKNPGFTPLLLNVHLHTIAEKYNIPALAEAANAKYAAGVKTAWKAEDFPDSVEAMYASDSPSKKDMQDYAINTAVCHAKELYTEDVGQQFLVMVGKTPGFAASLAAQLVRDTLVLTAPKIRIKVMTLTKKVFALEIKPRHTMMKIKKVLHAQEGIPPEQQTLVFSGQRPEDDKIVARLNIQEGSVLLLILNLPKV